MSCLSQFDLFWVFWCILCRKQSNTQKFALLNFHECWIACGSLKYYFTFSRLILDENLERIFLLFCIQHLTFNLLKIVVFDDFSSTWKLIYCPNTNFAGYVLEKSILGLEYFKFHSLRYLVLLEAYNWEPCFHRCCWIHIQSHGHFVVSFDINMATNGYSLQTKTRRNSGPAVLVSLKFKQTAKSMNLGLPPLVSVNGILQEGPSSTQTDSENKVMLGFILCWRKVLIFRFFYNAILLFNFLTSDQRNFVLSGTIFWAASSFDWHAGNIELWKSFSTVPSIKSLAIAKAEIIRFKVKALKNLKNGIF